MTPNPDSSLASERYCYLTTTGRRSGEPREIEIWFALEGSTVYLLSEGRNRSHWVRNLMGDSDVRVRIGETTLDGRARIVTSAEEDARARELLLAKYSESYSGDLTEWGETALPVAIDLR